MVSQEEIHRMTQSEYAEERRNAIEELRLNFAILPDKIQAQNDLHKLTQDEYTGLRYKAQIAVSEVFPDVPDKMQAWNDLLKIIQDQRVYFQGETEDAFSAVFLHIPNKLQAWNDLHRLAQDENIGLRWYVASVIGAVFSHIPDQIQAWDDLHRLSQDEDKEVREHAVLGISLAFPYIPDKMQAWNDLLRLVLNDKYVREWGGASVLGAIFLHVPNKMRAWNDLHKLTMHKDQEVRWRLAYALGKNFLDIPDKMEAFNDLHRFTLDQDSVVRQFSAYSLGVAFSLLPDKKQAWNDLCRLAQDGNNDVKASAYHSFGKVSIFKAVESESEEHFRKELEKALGYFERASSVSSVSYSVDPASFCNPFWHSYYAIIFKKEETEAEVQKYLTIAEDAAEWDRIYEINGWEIEKKLLESITHLTKALDFNTLKSDFNVCRQYIERVEELLETTEERAPIAVKIIRKGLPIIDQKMKNLLKEIEEKAKRFHDESRKTPLEEISRIAYDHVKGLGETENLIEAAIRLKRLGLVLRGICDLLPEESRGVVCNQLEEVKEAELLDGVKVLESTVNCFIIQHKSLQEKLSERDKLIEFLKGQVILRLDNISYGISRLKIRSGEIVPSLCEIQGELNRLKTVETNIENQLKYFNSSLRDLGELTHHDIQDLNNEITRLVGEIEVKVIPTLPQKSDTHALRDKLDKLKKSEKEAWFNRIAELSSIISLLIILL